MLELRDSRPREAHTLKKQIWEMIASEQFSKTEVIQSLSTLFHSELEPLAKFRLVLFMHEVYWRKYQYPEFFWILIESNMLFEVEANPGTIARISLLLCYTG